MKRISIAEIENLVFRFSKKNLPKKEWSHQAHIIIALWHNFNYEFVEALNLVRSKIKEYNLSVGTANTDNSGYHETLTVFWMMITRDFIKSQNKELEECCNCFLESEEASKELVKKYYTDQVLFSKKARKVWVNGDKNQVKFTTKTQHLLFP